jgi:hypothetical protein
MTRCPECLRGDGGCASLVLHSRGWWGPHPWCNTRGEDGWDVERNARAVAEAVCRWPVPSCAAIRAVEPQGPAHPWAEE